MHVGRLRPGELNGKLHRQMPRNELMGYAKSEQKKHLVYI